MIWSWYRDCLFQFCPRAYELHYFGGRGGFDPYASAQTRLIYRLKKLNSVEWWLDEIFTESIRAAVPFRLSEFKRHLFKLFRTGRAQVLTGSWLDDPGCVNLTELYYQEAEPEKLFDDSATELEKRIKVLERSDLFPQLKELTAVNTVKVKYPLEIILGPLECWISPVQIWRRNNELYFLNRLNREAEKFTGVLQCCWAMREQKVDPVRISFIGYDFETGEYREYPARELEISTVLDEIEKRAIALDAPSEKHNPGNCPRCRFREYCNNQSINQ